MFLHLRLSLLLCALLGSAVAHAESAAPTSGVEPSKQVFTRGTVKSVFDTHDGTRHYVRLKVGPGYGTPFSIWTFRVGDPVTLTQFPVGSSVAFFAKHIDGENTIVAMQAAQKMERYSVR